MVETILITLLIVAISLLLLGVKVFFTKGGKFPNGHVSGNKELRKKESVVRSRRIVKHKRNHVFLLMSWKKP